jgi:hypothetical protein
MSNKKGMVKRKVKEHKHEYESGIISLGYAMAGKGHLAMCKICHQDFNKATGELEEAF